MPVWAGLTVCAGLLCLCKLQGSRSGMLIRPRRMSRLRRASCSWCWRCSSVGARPTASLQPSAAVRSLRRRSSHRSCYPASLQTPQFRRSSHGRWVTIPGRTCTGPFRRRCQRQHQCPLRPPLQGQGSPSALMRSLSGHSQFLPASPTLCSVCSIGSNSSRCTRRQIPRGRMRRRRPARTSWAGVGNSRPLHRRLCQQHPSCLRPSQHSNNPRSLTPPAPPPGVSYPWRRRCSGGTPGLA